MAPFIGRRDDPLISLLRWRTRIGFKADDEEARKRFAFMVQRMTIFYHRTPGIRKCVRIRTSKGEFWES